MRIVVKLFFGLEIHYQNFEAVRHFSGLVASNHCSNIDPPAVGISVPFGMCYFAKEELNTNFIMKLIFKKIPMLWVNRDNPTPASIKQTIDALQDGRPLLVFPEGTRSPDGTIQQAKSGAGMIACKAMVPILPVYVEGTYDILPKGASMPKFHKVRVYVGTPYKLETSPFSGKSKKEIYQLASAEMIERIIAIKNNKLR
ncbi:MAG: lysophospholipid acyltransferase family protein [Candidatus Auribacterota bacterium]